MRPDYSAGDIDRNGDRRASSGLRQGFPLRAQETLQGAFRRPPAILVSVLSPQPYPAVHREPVQVAPAWLPMEDDEVDSGCRLAERFVKPAADSAQAAPSRSRGLRPFLPVGVLLLAAAFASAVYLAKSGALVPVVSAYAAVAIDEQPAGSFAKSQAEAQAAEPAQTSAAGNSWADALETFKALVRSQAADTSKDQAE